jgi:hypothetical protein
MDTGRCGGLASQWTTANGWRVYARIADVADGASHGLGDEGTSRHQRTLGYQRRAVGETYPRLRSIPPPEGRPPLPARVPCVQVRAASPSMAGSRSSCG